MSRRRIVAGRYRLEERIGSGAMGVVWRGTDERLGRPVAVKQVFLHGGLDEVEAEEVRQRTLREGRIAARLQHQHAISVFDVSIEGDEPWLVMEYLPSRSLAAVLTEHGPLDPRLVARIGRQVADALDAAHEAGIVHRDVKPGNVLIGADGTVKITDFGISRASGDLTLTRTGMLAGTPAYLAPEVARGEDSTAASDVFSLGATLYAAVEGVPPFGADDNALALLHAVGAGAVNPPLQAGPMTALLMQLLRADPAERPTAAEGRQSLGRVAHAGGTYSGPGRRHAGGFRHEDSLILGFGTSTGENALPDTGESGLAEPRPPADGGGPTGRWTPDAPSDPSRRAVPVPVGAGPSGGASAVAPARLAPAAAEFRRGTGALGVSPAATGSPRPGGEPAPERARAAPATEGSGAGGPTRLAVALVLVAALVAGIALGLLLGLAGSAPASTASPAAPVVVGSGPPR